MSFQLALELPPAACLHQFTMPPELLARWDDPETSKEASKRAAKELVAKHHALIVAVLKEHGPGGKDFIASRSKLDGVAVCRRLSELHRLGLIKLTGRLVISTAGRNEREWEVA